MPSFTITRRKAVLAVAASLALGHGAWAQEAWPQKPIRLIVPFAPGGSNDNIARVVSQKMGMLLGRPMVVENKGGSGGVIGTDFVAGSPADGYTLLFVSSSIITNAVSGKKVNNDPLKSFTPIGKVGSTPLAIVSANQVPAKNLQEFIAYAKANPGKVHYGTAGVGGLNHLASELFAHSAGISLVHVPYKGISQAYVDLMGGSLQAMLPSLTVAVPQIAGGKYRGLAVTGKTRSALLPDLPTAAEAGLPGFELDVWFGLMAPAGLPQPIAATLNRTLNQVLADADTQNSFRAEAITPLPGTAEELARQMTADAVLWRKVIKDNNIKLDEN